MTPLSRVASAAAGYLMIGVLATAPAPRAMHIAAPLTRLGPAGGHAIAAPGVLRARPSMARRGQSTLSATDPTSPGAVRIPPPPPLYYQTVKEQIARWLHLTVAQIKRKLQSETDLFYVASDQGVRDVPNQVPRHEIVALQTASQTMVRMHVWTHQQADANMRYWRHVGAKLLTHTLSQWFRER